MAQEAGDHRCWAPATKEAALPRFYFHLRGPREALSQDELGVVFPDVETAYLEADRAVSDLAREMIKKGRNPRSYAFEITNASGELLLELPFSETLDRQMGRGAANLHRTRRVTTERAERMMRLTSEVAEQTKAAQENLRRAQDLMNSLRSRGTVPRDPAGKSTGEPS